MPPQRRCAGGHRLRYLTPLYIAYVTELAAKQRFAECVAQSAGQRRHSALSSNDTLWRVQVYVFAYINMSILLLNATATLAYRGWI